MENIITIQNLNKTYKSKKNTVSVFENYNLEIPKGELTAIMGKSGSGKSTLLQILGFLDSPDSGIVNIDGHIVNYEDKKSIFEIRSQYIGFVFQGFYLMPELTVFENVELPLLIAEVNKHERKIKVELTLQNLGILDKANFYPNQISGGQIQRVAIARAIVNSPKIILADEPTGNLDEVTANEVIELFRSVQKNQGTTVIIVTHSKEIAKKCDNIVNIDK
jgi:ABC-type lipoprotein export system ATPase subunit